ncbi:hypothetical protein [Kitasatospora sp. MAP5-34]|uniref:hypothetical protein n=1 Tax=Kitasatospora sp. MAP5-34 TaxID=3035102 RepID=UPI0024749F06|nr:hypothetical protein [Kitasatospora sp. MAP5-34]MDH6580475.1 putative benzoate:H+ symporter BenE [Kitasatospora sp. MAP5-34]
MVVFLALTVVAIVLGLVGVVVHGLLYLLFIGIVLFVAGIAYLGASGSARRRSPR